MTIAPARQPSTGTGIEPAPVLASTVLQCGDAVAGSVPTEVHPHALGHPERQVSVRIGDAVVSLSQPAVAARIRQQGDAAHYLATVRLPQRVSQTWLGWAREPTPSVSRCG